MSTTRNANLKTRRRSPKAWGPLRSVSREYNKRPQRQKSFRYHHYA